jgi:CBS-domain-containing membrane protein
VGDATIRDLGFYFVLMPAGAGAVLMVLIALVVNNVFPARQYPQYWW